MKASSLAGRILACVLLATPIQLAHASHPALVAPALAADITGTVTDSGSAQPLPSVDIVLLRATTAAVVTTTTTDRFGHFTLHNVPAGSYTIVARFFGFAMVRRPITVTGSTAQSVAIAMVPAAPVTLEAVQSTAQAAAVDTRTGVQVLDVQAAATVAPTQTTSQVVQENIAGAARAPTGEVHINGQHAEYTYYVDGVPVPSGVSGSLNEIFSPEVVDQIGFQTGGWDAEYGNNNAAVINVTTKIPSGGFHMNVGSYFGAFDQGSTAGPTGVNGSSISASTNSGPWGVFVSGAHQFSDMRLEPVVDAASANKVDNFHNSGTDDFGFGKLQYAAGKNNVFDLDVNLSQTKFAVPYDSTGGVNLDDHQRDVNSFLNLAWHHQAGDSAAAGAASSNIFAGLFYRHGSLTYTPGLTDDPSFIFFPDTATPYNLNERRYFNTYGIKLDYSVHPAHDLEFKFGTTSSATTGHENFSTVDASGNAGPASVSGLTGSDVGVYAQTAWSPVEQFEIRTGVRYDAHTAPFAGTVTQVSPRIRLNYFPSTSTTLFVYYGRMFLPTNIEDLRSITSISQADSVTTPTLPERDNWFEGGFIQRFPSAGLIASFDGFYKTSSPGIDDNTVPGSSIVTDVNINKVWIKGVKAVLQYQGSGSLSAGINAAITHAYGEGPITGGFFPTATPQGFFDLDHDQRLSLSANANYAPTARSFLGATVIYGSGLTNAKDSTDCACKYGTGLFDFNAGTKVKPSTILDLSLGYKAVIAGTVVKPQLNIDNVFDQMYLLKGDFFSGASVGRPREITLRLNVEY